MVVSTLDYVLYFLPHLQRGLHSVLLYISIVLFFALPLREHVIPSDSFTSAHLFKCLNFHSCWSEKKLNTGVLYYITDD